jgi:hypothetical protein
MEIGFAAAAELPTLEVAAGAAEADRIAAIEMKSTVNFFIAWIPFTGQR